MRERLYNKKFNLKTKPVSPSEVLWYAWCPKGHNLHYTIWVGDRGWIGNSKQEQVRAYAHALFQAMREKDLWMTKSHPKTMEKIYDDFIIKPSDEQFYMDAQQLGRATGQFNHELYYRIEKKEKKELREKVKQSKLAYEELKIKRGVEPKLPVAVEKRHLDDKIEAYFDTVFDFQDGRLYKLLGETKCFSNDEKKSLTEHIQWAEIQMRVAYQAFKKHYGKPYSHGLLTIITDNNYPEKFFTYDRWVKDLGDNEEKTQALMQETKYNRFKKLEDITEQGDCNVCSLKGVCEVYGS
jgi:hypothetical protein